MAGQVKAKRKARWSKDAGARRDAEAREQKKAARKLAQWKERTRND